MKRLLAALCLMGALGLAPVVAESGPDYPDRLEILSLLRDRQFETLTSLLEGLQDGYESGTATDSRVNFAYEAIANSDPAHEPLLDEWVEVMPDHYVPLAARGMYRVNRGWNARGDRLARNTDDAQIRGMKSYHALALADMRAVIDRRPRFMVAYAEIISMAKSKRSDELRDDTLKAALAIDPASYEVRKSYLFGLMPRWGGSYGAIRTFAADTQTYVDQDPGLAGLTVFESYVRALNLYEDADYDQAIALYDQILERADANWFHLQRALAYYYKKDYEPALADINASLERWPQNPRALIWRSAIYRKLDRNDEALADAALAVRLEPYDFKANRELATVLIRFERYEEAVEAYRAALHYANTSADVWYRLGWYLHYKLDRHQEAIAAFEAAARHNPKPPRHWYHYGVALNQQLDCDIVAVLETYLERCAQVGSEYPSQCKANRKDWASGVTEHLVATDKCPAASPRPVASREESSESWGFWDLFLNALLEVIQEWLAGFRD